MQLSPIVYLSLVSLVSLLIGIYFVRKGLRYSTKGDIPYCKKCSYNLLGMTSQRCPECGSEITADLVIFGMARRRYALVAMGCLYWVPALFLANTMFKSINWYGFVSTERVLTDLQSRNHSLSSKAWREFLRRKNVGKITHDQYDSLIDICLKHQDAFVNHNSQSLSSLFLDELGKAFARNDLNNSEREMFLANTARVEIQMRPRILLGDSIPYQMIFRGAIPMNWWIKFVFDPFRVEDEALPKEVKDLNMRGPFGGMKQPGRLNYTKPGAHVLSMHIKVQIFEGPEGDITASKLHSERRLQATAPFEVSANESHAGVQLINAPDLLDKIKASIEIDHLTYTQTPKPTIKSQIKLAKPPMSIAFEILTQVDGIEKRVGVVTWQEDSRDINWDGVWWNPLGPPPSSVDLIFRSSKEVAAKTLDLYKIWNGEFILENVPVIVEEK